MDWTGRVIAGKLYPDVALKGSGDGNNLPETYASSFGWMDLPGMVFSGWCASGIGRNCEF